MVVVDASIALPACVSAEGFSLLATEDLVAPPLLWSEARSALHEALRRAEISADDARQARDSLEAAPIRSRTHRRLGEVAWRLADELGWPRTYDAEYVALAQLLGCRLVTLDARLVTGAARLGNVVGPGDL